MPIDKVAMFLVLITMAFSWPVVFYLIRRQARKSGPGGDWRHAAFFLGPFLAPVVFLLFKISESRQTRQGDFRASIGNHPVGDGPHGKEA
jgi:hypothetical protein